MQEADAEFYRRIQFKTVVICDLSNPLIKRSDMLFNCDVCGRRAHRVSEWQLKNKSYRAEFICRHCQHRFFGRVQFKLKYEGLIVKKYILPFREKPKEEHPKETVPAEAPECAVNGSTNGESC